MPGKSTKSQVRSVRIPNDLWEELGATAEAGGRTRNEEIVRRLSALRDPSWSPAPDPNTRQIPALATDSLSVIGVAHHG